MCAGYKNLILNIKKRGCRPVATSSHTRIFPGVHRHKQRPLSATGRPSIPPSPRRSLQSTRGAPTLSPLSIDVGRDLSVICHRYISCYGTHSLTRAGPAGSSTSFRAQAPQIDMEMISQVSLFRLDVGCKNLAIPDLIRYRNRCFLSYLARRKGGRRRALCDSLLRTAQWPDVRRTLAT